MEAPQQTLPRMEPGHVSDQKLPRVEGVGVHDDVAPSEYPKYIDHPTRGLTLANDADHEAMLREEIANLPPVPPPTQEALAKAELEKTLGRPLTDLECMVGAKALLAFVKDKSTIVVFHPDMEPEPDPIEEMLKYGVLEKAPDTETKVYADGSSATGTAPLPDVSPEGAPVSLDQGAADPAFAKAAPAAEPEAPPAE